MVEYDDDACMAGEETSSEATVVVSGVRPNLRVVDFSGGGTSGESTCPGREPSLEYSKKEAALWPADERARFLAKKPFEVRCTAERDLFWFTSIDRDGDPWQSRLRDGKGNILPLTFVNEGKRTTYGDRTLLLREGERLYFWGGQIR